MYDIEETDISFRELALICEECKKKKVPIRIIGGWATFFYVNENFRRAFGRDYLSSRDIDLFFPSEKEKELAEIVSGLGFAKGGLRFRYEKNYHRELKKFVSEEEAKKAEIFNLIRIFLDLFSNKQTRELGSWNDLEPLKTLSVELISGFPVADINTLAELKAIALFARDKADKEHKDACDLYALLQYSGRRINSSACIKKAVEKLIIRSELINSIAHHVLADIGKRSIAELTLRNNLAALETQGYYQSPDT